MSATVADRQPDADAFYRTGRALMQLGLLRHGVDSHMDMAASYLAGPVCASIAGARMSEFAADLALSLVHVAKTLPPGRERAARAILAGLAAELHKALLKEWPTIERFAKRGPGEPDPDASRVGP